MKTIDLKEFTDQGYLQELNRQFLHPLGMAMSVIVDEDTGETTFGSIWDSREDPEGYCFGEGVLDKEKTDRVKKEQQERRTPRKEKLGYYIQPVE